MGFTMKGTIRAKGACPACQKPWPKNTLLCGCGRVPKRGIYIDLSWDAPARRLKIYADKRGQKFGALLYAQTTLGAVRSAIDTETFDPDDYLPRSQQAKLWPNVCDAFLGRQQARVDRGDLSEGSLRMYSAHIRNHIRLAPMLAKRDLPEIKGVHIQEFQDWLDKKPLSTNTKANVFAALRLLFSDAERLGQLDRKPRFPVVRRSDPVHCRPSEEDRDAIIRKIRAEHQPIFTFLRYQPVRPVEACRLQRSMLHLEDDPAWVEIPRRIRKAGAGYSQPLHPAVREMLRSMPPAGILVFVHADGRPYTSDQIGKIWRYAAEKAARPEPTLYEGTRHAIATDAANRGEDIGRIAAALGNTVGMTAKHYVTFRAGTLLPIICPEAAQPKRLETGPASDGTQDK